VIGRRFGADEVALEASEAMARWKRDLGPLASYGFGQERSMRLRGTMTGTEDYARRGVQAKPKFGKLLYQSYADSPC